MMQKNFIFVLIIVTYLVLANSQQTLPFAPSNPGAPTPWGSMPQHLSEPSPFTAPGTSPNIPAVQNPNTLTQSNMNNYEFAASPAAATWNANQLQGQFNPAQPMAFDQRNQPFQPNFVTQSPIQYSRQGQIQNPMINPMQQSMQFAPAPGMGFNAPENLFTTQQFRQSDNTYTTQQFRPRNRNSFPSFQAPSSGNFDRFSAPSGPSFPNIDPSILNNVANSFGPTFSRSASQLTSIPATIMQQSQDQIAQSSAAAGMSTEEGQAIVQTAMQRGASILSPPRPKPSSCDKMDFECQFYRACFGCFANRNQPHCMYCLDLDNCAGDLACQTQKACPVCDRLPKSEAKPGACDILKC